MRLHLDPKTDRYMEYICTAFFTMGALTRLLPRPESSGVILLFTRVTPYQEPLTLLVMLVMLRDVHRESLLRFVDLRVLPGFYDVKTSLGN